MRTKEEILDNQGGRTDRELILESLIDIRDTLVGIGNLLAQKQ